MVLAVSGCSPPLEKMSDWKGTTPETDPEPTAVDKLTTPICEGRIGCEDCGMICDNEGRV